MGWPAWMSPWGLCLWLVGRAAGRRCPRQSVPLTAVGFVAAGDRGAARQQSLGRRHGGQKWGGDSGVKIRQTCDMEQRTDISGGMDEMQDWPGVQPRGTRPQVRPASPAVTVGMLGNAPTPKENLFRNGVGGGFRQ